MTKAMPPPKSEGASGVRRREVARQRPSRGRCACQSTLIPACASIRPVSNSGSPITPV